MGEERSHFWKLFDGIRRVAVFVLGVAVIVFALRDPESGNTVAMLAIGMVMVGVLPIENLLSWRITRR